ncbi:hypothetical protein UA08_01106 [Talaromyces atroroseus]|uniref:Glycosyl hydrolase family 13 catalytic domain-containing protein n=1 Tax=Talaromyces atroroseus TaxID=1441469 RepID=A0A225AWM5_TALAT|nr:hypothetical protein UA08_01106 [Talaromyces atroroseus]OKL64013.1 hypothetical protein UA08_01106 [Talaromyces atroroseus]
MECLRSCFSSCSRRKQENWKQIEEEAKSIEKLPSWHSPDDNVCMLEAFEWYVPHDGRHWQRLQQALPELKDIGIDNLLLPPGCKAMNASGNGYDIYDLYDLGEFDQKGTVATKWGTKDDLERLAQSAEELEMGIYWDAVLNHKAGADRTEKCLAVTVDPKDRNIDLTKPQEIEAWVGFDFAGRGEAYSKMKYHWQHFNGTDYNNATKKNAIYKIFAPGKDWARDVSFENGNYDYLMFANLDYSHPEVREDVLNWIEWIGGQLPLRGMRLDAVKHYSSEFQSVLVDRIRQTVGRDWFIVSEFWSGNVVELQQYLKQINRKVHLFDAPLCQRLSAISQARCADLRLIFDQTLVKHEPEHAVTFVMNHDTQPSQSLEAPIPSSFKPLAYSLILLRKDGYPCVFYGDLYGISNEQRKHPSNAVNSDSHYHQILPKLILARKLYAYGEQQDYFTRRNCIGFVRYGNARHPWGMACVINNGLAGTKLRMFVGRKHAGEKWTDVLVESERGPSSHKQRKTKGGMVHINSKGYADFSVASMSVSVWVNVEAGGTRKFGRRFNSDIYSY